MTIIGFLNLNKPAGITSHDCVAQIRRILKLKKVGHGGTLDPAATGVLPIAVGKATRLLQFLPTKKIYQARIRFGVTTTTDDLEGEIIASQSGSSLSIEAIKPCLNQFIGKIEQIPPAYSAIKQGGKKLYQLARKNEQIDIPKRQVEIDQIDILAWYPGEFPELEIAIACGSGTYIRAIARDLGKILNVGGTLASLTRILSGGMELANSLTLEEIKTQAEIKKLALISADFPLQHLPPVYLAEEEANKWCQGQKISYHLQQNSSLLRVYDGSKRFLGIATAVTESYPSLIAPKIVLSTQ